MLILAHKFEESEMVYRDDWILCAFIPEICKRATLLHTLKWMEARFIRTQKYQSGFESLKQALSEDPILQDPDFEKEFVLVTDPSDLAISAVLKQRVGEVLAPVSYYSHLLNSTERRYSTYEKECLAVLFGCEKCITYLDIMS